MGFALCLRSELNLSLTRFASVEPLIVHHNTTQCSLDQQTVPATSTKEKLVSSQEKMNQVLAQLPVVSLPIQAKFMGPYMVV